MKVTKATYIFDRIIDIGAILAGIIIAFATLSVCAEVFMRYFMGEVLTWVIDITAILLLYMTFLATAWLLRMNGHVTMDIVVSRLNPKTQSILNIINSTIVTIVCMAMIWYGTKLTWLYSNIGVYIPTALETPKWLVLIIIPIGSFLLFIQSLRRTYNHLKSWTLTVAQKDHERKADI